MPISVSSWKLSFFGRYFGKHKSKSSVPIRRKCLRPELLDERNLLAADLVPLSFYSDGTDLVVQYDVQNQNAAPFDVGVYSSADGVTPDTLLQMHRFDDASEYSVGSHTQSIVANFTDSTDDYKLLMVFDVNDEVAEANENDNDQLFDGGVFRSGDIVHVHGSAVADTVSISNGTAMNVTLNGVTHTFGANVSEVHVRTQAGDDTVSSANSRNLWAFGGDGSDSLTGGAGNDWLSGGDGRDTLDGRGAIDWMEGDDGDDVMTGGAGDDAMFGGAGYDRLEGESGDDFISGDDDPDLIYGGPGADMLLGMGGNDVMYSDAADTLVDPGSGLNTLESEDDGYGGYGPELTDLQVTFLDGTLTVSGNIDDDDTDGATVTVGGEVDEAADANADQNGDFVVDFEDLDPIYGWVSVVVTDADGNVTSTEWVLITDP